MIHVEQRRASAAPREQGRQNEAAEEQQHAQTPASFVAADLDAPLPKTRIDRRSSGRICHRRSLIGVRR
jgi:hypothetical protein